MIASSNLTDAVNARMSPISRLLSVSIGKLVAYSHRRENTLYKNARLAALFSNPYTRRALYKEAHTDVGLATRVIAADPLYAQRAALTPFQKRVRFMSERLLFIPLAGVEGIVGGPLDWVETTFFKSRRTFAGRLFDDFMYIFSDMFHSKRLLYTLEPLAR